MYIILNVANFVPLHMHRVAILNNKLQIRRGFSLLQTIEGINFGLARMHVTLGKDLH